MGMGDVAGRHPRCTMTASQMKSSHHRTFRSTSCGPHTALSASHILTLFFWPCHVACRLQDLSPLLGLNPHSCNGSMES